MSDQKHIHTAKLISWDQKKGFGFLQHGKRRVFLHWREFTVKHRRPVAGDEVRFVMGKDRQGRRCAQEAELVSKTGKLPLTVWVCFLLLLILPALALYQSKINILWAGAYALIISIITYQRYAQDKKLARTNEWRTPEAQLQFLDILGGWPGGFLAQRRFQHKSSKGTFQFIFWLVVVLYQLLAIDCLRGWPIVSQALGIR